LEDSVCLNVSTELLGGVTQTDTVGVEVPPGSFPIGGNFAGLTALPDGSGAVYETTINMTGLGNGTVTSASDISSICLDIEHSYIGDIEIALTCPNGTMVSLVNAYNAGGGELVPGGCGNFYGIFFGNDTDQDGGAPGSPVWTYCFSEVNATTGSVCDGLTGSTNQVTNANGFTAMDPNFVYQPDGSWSDFIGCPLEGPWTITVQDNQGVDDGYIFQWSILFDAALYPDPETYQNVIVSDFWSPDPTIITGQNDTAIVVLPTVSGPHSYTYNVTDDFGCSYDTTVVLFVMDNPVIFPDTNTCHFIFNSSGNYAYQGGVWSSADTCIHFLPNNTTLNPTIVSTLPGVHTVTFTDNACNVTQSSDIYFQPYPYVEVNDNVNCAGAAVQLLASSNPDNDTYVWNTGESGIAINVMQEGTYWVTVTNECGQWVDSAKLVTHICDIQAPNIIVLSSNQGNNAWFINYDGITEYSVSIVNRWQNVIFESNDPAVQWKGTDSSGNQVTEGTYFYTIRATLLSGEVLEKQGFIQVYH
jgi:subtilisin-like proprotein convertase family protein